MTPCEFVFLQKQKGKAAKKSDAPGLEPLPTTVLGHVDKGFKGKMYCNINAIMVRTHGKLSALGRYWCSTPLHLKPNLAAGEEEEEGDGPHLAPIERKLLSSGISMPVLSSILVVPRSRNASPFYLT